MASLAEIKTQSGKAGGELQQEDVRRLRKEVEIKMEKLNEIRKVGTPCSHKSLPQTYKRYQTFCLFSASCNKTRHRNPSSFLAEAMQHIKVQEGFCLLNGKKGICTHWPLAICLPSTVEMLQPGCRQNMLSVLASCTGGGEA